MMIGKQVTTIEMTSPNAETITRGMNQHGQQRMPNTIGMIILAMLAPSTCKTLFSAQWDTARERSLSSYSVHSISNDCLW